MSNEQLLLHTIRKLVGENQLEEAIEQLCDYLQSKDSASLDTALLLKRRLIQLEEREMKSIITFGEADLSKNRISEDILRLIRRISPKNEA